MSENIVMTFLIKKRINTEPFIDGKQGFYIQKDRIKKLYALLKEGKQKWAKIGVNANN